jgi:ATP-dependent Clp protease ATP-binding subunit ClpA
MAGISSQAEEVLRLAREEARLFQHASVDTHHLLLGLLQGEEARPASILQQLGVDLLCARETSERVKRGGDGLIRVTQDLRRTVHLAAEEAEKRGQAVFTVDHLLLALTLLPDSKAHSVLQDMGINLKELHDQTLLAFPLEQQPGESPPFQGETGVRQRDKFTPLARRALSRAGSEAFLFEQSLDLETLCLGFLCAGEGTAFQVLKRLGVDLNALEQACARLLSSRDPSPVILAPRCRRAIQLAVRAAIRFTHRYLGTEHLLLGMLGASEEGQGGLLARLRWDSTQREESATSRMFADFGLSLKRARKETAAALLAGANDD